MLRWAYKLGSNVAGWSFIIYNVYGLICASQHGTLTGCESSEEAEVKAFHQAHININDLSNVSFLTDCMNLVMYINDRMD